MQMLSFTAGQRAGYPCELFAYYGFSGLKPQLIDRIAAWLRVK